MVDDARTIGADGAARCVLAVRRMLRDVISPDLMANPAVDMLLALYLAPDRTLPWDEVCATTDTSMYSCQRWGKALEERGLIEIGDDGCRLSAEGGRVMADVNGRVWQLAASHLSADLRPPAGDRGQAADREVAP